MFHRRISRVSVVILLHPDLLEAQYKNYTFDSASCKNTEYCEAKALSRVYIRGRGLGSCKAGVRRRETRSMRGGYPAEALQCFMAISSHHKAYKHIVEVMQISSQWPGAPSAASNIGKVDKCGRCRPERGLARLQRVVDRAQC